MSRLLIGIPFVLALLFLGMASGIVLASSTDTRQTVLILDDTAQAAAGVSILDENFDITIRHLLSDRVRVDRQYIDFTKVDASNGSTFIQYLQSLYPDKKPDAIVAVGKNTLEFILKNGGLLFSNTPIISAGLSSDEVNAMNLPPTITGVTLSTQFWPTVALALKLQPKTVHVAVVAGSGPDDQKLMAAAKLEIESHKSGLDFIYLAGLPLSELIQKVGSLPPSTIILYLSVTQDTDGNIYLPREVLENISHKANAPTYIVSDRMLHRGAVGGVVVSYADCGRQTAKLVARFLKGKPTGSIPFVDASKMISTIDEAEAQRWGIPITTAPTGTEIKEQNLTPWQRYYGWFIAGGVLLVLQSILIIRFIITDRKRRTAEKSLRASENRMTMAVKDERNRLARDVHDTLAPGFTGVIIQLEAAEQAFIHGSLEQVNQHILRAGELARESLGEARRSLKALRSTALENGDLSAAIENSIHRIVSGSGIDAEISVRGLPRPLEDIVEDNLLRILQEIATNAVRHSGASTLTGTIYFREADVLLDMADNGLGFDVSRIRNGLGLLGIEERVGQMRGEFQLASVPGHGTRISVTIPDKLN